MAKWGEGDPRWIVEERPDATNVNNWHWTEKNATPWSKARLKELLEGVSVKSGSGDNLLEARITKLTKVDGEATANNRKAKLIFLFEWELKAEWEGTDGEATEVKGELDIPNLSDENEASEVDVNVTANDSSDAAYKLKQLWIKQGTPEIRKRLGQYIAGLKEEFSSGIILPTAKNGAPAAPTTVDAAKAAKAKAEVVGGMGKMEVSGKSGSGCKIPTTKISLKDEFKAPASEVFAAFTSQDMLSAFSNSPAVSEASKGGKFSLYGGMVEGTYEALDAPTSLVLNWRMKSYPTGHHARISLTFSEDDGMTKLKLEATSVPEEEAEKTQDGWQRHYFQNIKRTFGFGAMLF